MCLSWGVLCKGVYPEVILLNVSILQCSVEIWLLLYVNWILSPLCVHNLPSILAMATMKTPGSHHAFRPLPPALLRAVVWTVVSKRRTVTCSRLSKRQHYKESALRSAAA